MDGIGRYLGDVDLDSKVTSADSRLILRHSIGLEEFNSFQLRLADLNRDGQITAEDARLALRTSVGTEPLILLSSNQGAYKIIIPSALTNKNVGDKFELATNTGRAKWQSSNTSVLTVSDSGSVTIKSSTGTATITARDSDTRKKD